MSERYLYLHGFASGPSSSKAAYFQEKFAAEGVELLVPDLACGDFENLTITGQLQVVKELAGEGPVTLIGSSLGGYLAALYAARHPEVTKLVLLAPAFAFIERCPEEFPREQFAMWKQTGYIQVFHYGEHREMPLSYRLIQDGSRYESYPEVSQPVLIFHGIHDRAVPYSYAETFAKGRSNVTLHILNSDHQLLDVLDRIWETARPFLLAEAKEPCS
jgi:uncharacterized protein